MSRGRAGRTHHRAGRWGGPTWVPVVLAAALLSGCGLPLRQGVLAPGSVPAGPALPEPIGVLPPGPQPGADPQSLVAGFLGAQSNGQDGHGIARSFLAEQTRAAWQDGAGATVYDLATRSFDSRVSGDSAVVTVGIDVIGGVTADGVAFVQSPSRGTQTYRMRRDNGQWRLVEVPAGLTVTAGDRDRAFAATEVYFLAPAVGGPANQHLVADRLLLPAAGDRAQRVVSRLLVGPSSELGPSAGTAVPAGTRLVSPVTTSATGEVTVNLSKEAGRLAQQQRQDLSAQLVWSLRAPVPAFTRLRLLVDGHPLQVAGQSSQPRQAWPGYDPDGSHVRPPSYALVDGQLNALDQPVDDQRTSALTERKGIVDAAVNPRAASVALLTSQAGTRSLYIGPLTGPQPSGPDDPNLRSPSWGSGERGLWLLRTGPDPALLLVSPGGARTVVPVPDLPPLGPDPVLRMSRDGVRVALVADGTLLVGRIEPAVDGVRVVALKPLATDVLDVAWQTGTTLVALVKDTRAPLLPVERLSVDGTSVSASGLLGVTQGDPVAIAASGDRPLLVETVLAGVPTTYRGDDGRGFEVGLTNARRPLYPG